MQEGLEKLPGQPSSEVCLVNDSTILLDLYFDQLILSGPGLG